MKMNHIFSQNLDFDCTQTLVEYSGEPVVSSGVARPVMMWKHKIGARGLGPL